MADRILSRRSPFPSALGVSLASCGLALLLLAAVYALRGIWPFGTDNVAYVDTAQFYLPNYYLLWDALHGASRSVSWYAGLAESGAASLRSLLDPANLAFLLAPRDHILEGLSLYLAVYAAGIALAASVAVNLRFPRLAPRWRVVLVLCYTFSGYVLQYYANFGWLWTVAAFPFVPLALERLLRDGRPLFYGLVYAWFLWHSVYFAYMVTIYVLLFSFGYAVFLLPRERRGDRLLRLGLATAAAFGLTAGAWLSSSASLAGTSRFQSNLDNGLLAGFTTWDLTNTRHTVLMLLGMAPAAALLLRALARQRRRPDGRRAAGIRFFALLLGAMAIPMVFTNIDTAWHFGQYNFFPMRYGFMLPATLLSAAGLCLEEEQAAPLPPEPGRRRAARGAACLAIAAALAVLEPRLAAFFREYGACFLPAMGAKAYWTRYFPLLAGCGVLFTALYLLLLRSRRKAAAWVVAAAVLLQLGANAYGLAAPSDDHVYTHEYDPAYAELSDSLHEYFAGRELSPLSRFKNVDNSLNAGYPSIAGVSALSSVASSNSALRLGVFRDLGYTVNYFRILDTGGTVFSDMLLGVDRVLSAEPLDDTLYADTGVTVDGIRLGGARYAGVTGLMYPAGALDGYLDLLTLPERLNALYDAFTGAGEALAFRPEAVLAAGEGEGLRSYALTCELPEAAFLYLAADAPLLNITAGGRPVPVPTYRNTENLVYPAAFNSNLLYLGRFDAGSVTITFLSAALEGREALDLTALSAERVASFAEDARRDPGMTVEYGADTLALTLTAPEDGLCLFLPLTCREIWQCTVNGQAAALRPVMGVLMSVPLQAGENTVRLTPASGGFRLTPARIVSLATLGLVVLWLALARRRTGAVLPPGRLGTAVCAVFYAVCAAAALFLYAAPTVLLLLRGTIVSF